MADSTAAIVVPQCVISTTDPAFPAATDEVSFTPSSQGLLELFLTVSDGRSNQGRDHPVAVVLALRLAGRTDITEATRWANRDT